MTYARRKLKNTRPRGKESPARNYRRGNDADSSPRGRSKVREEAGNLKGRGRRSASGFDSPRPTRPIKSDAAAPREKDSPGLKLGNQFSWAPGLVKCCRTISRSIFARCSLLLVALVFSPPPFSIIPLFPLSRGDTRTRAISRPLKEVPISGISVR